MFSWIRIVTLVFIVSCLHKTTGYTWVTVTSNDLIPKNGVKLDRVNSLDTYVGRARYRNLILPVEIYNSTYAKLAWNSNTYYTANEFEILTADDNACKWKKFDNVRDIPGHVVRAGTDWNGEPIYLVVEWPEVNGDRYALVCDDNTKWVDAVSSSLPDHSVCGGMSVGGLDIFVGRLLTLSSFVPGQVIPSKNITTAIYNGEKIKSPYCEVLVTGLNEYIWEPTKNGHIPDYAVVGGLSERNEIRYVAKGVDGVLGYVEYGSFEKEGDFDYAILVRKVT